LKLIRLTQEILREDQLQRSLAHHALYQVMRLHQDEAGFASDAGFVCLPLENAVPAENTIQVFPRQAQVPGSLPDSLRDQP